MPIYNYDYLIIGQGLAGSVLAHQLKHAGRSVLVLDNDHKASSSNVAAGIINPVTGHRLNITEGFAHLYPSAHKYYTTLQQELGVELWQVMEQHRLIKNQGQLDYLHKRSSDSAYKDLISELTHSKHFPNATFGTTQIAKTAVVNVASLLQSTKTWLIEQESYLSTKVDYARFEFSNKGVRYNEFSASKVICCEGFQAINNPWLRHLPFKLSKGEVLTIELPNQQSNQPQELLNWGNWLLPTSVGIRSADISSADTKSVDTKPVEKSTVAKSAAAKSPVDTSYKLGSSYEWDNTNLEPTLAVKDKLLDALTKHTALSGAELIQHKAGIRPTTKHRKPFIGSLPQHEQIICFNGFGSKGCLLVPYYAELLVNHLIKHTPLPTELTQCL